MARKKSTGQAITKQEAVRRVMAEFGPDTPAADIRKHVKEKFGFDMTMDHVYVARGNIRRALAGKKGGRAKKATAAAPAGGTSTGSTKVSLEDLHTLQKLIQRVGAHQLTDLVGMLAK
jgi:hypothetical protein